MTPAGPIRVALLIDTLRPAGAEKQLVTVATGLDRRRFAPRVLCLTDGGAYEDALREAGVPVTLIGKRRKLGGLALRRLRALLRRERPHLLHTWMFTCNLYGRLAALGLPIATLASEVAADVTKSAVRLAIDRLLAPATHAFYVNSTLVARFYHERCGIPLEKLVVIPNGVRVPEMPRVPRAALGVREDAFLVCCAGRLSPEKGFDRVIEALGTPRLRARNVELIIAGEGPSRDALATSGRPARPRGARSSARAPGGPARRAEGGRRVRGVVAARGDVQRPHGGHGARPALRDHAGRRASRSSWSRARPDWSIEASAPEPIAAALGQLLDDPALARRLGVAARERMAREFSIEANVRRFEALYEALATRGRPG